MGMTHVVDRRLNGKNKSAVNRERFLRRYRHHFKKAVADAGQRRSITDIERGENVSIPSRDIEAPVFHPGQGGRREVVQGPAVVAPRRVNPGPVRPQRADEDEQHVEVASVAECEYILDRAGGARVSAVTLIAQEASHSGDEKCDGGDDCRIGQSPGGDQHSGYCCGSSPANRLAETHECVKTTLLPNRREIDRHAVYCNVLCRRKTVNQHSDKHQQAHLIGRRFH